MTHPRFPYSRRRHVDPVAAADAIVVTDLTADYPGSDQPAIENIGLRVAAGTRVALVGPNGAGKSTLLKAIAGLLRPRRGDIRIHGNPVGACHHRVAYLPQRGDVDWRFPISVERLVLTGRYVHLGWFGRPGPSDYAISHEMLARLGIDDLSGRQIGKLSGGQQQRALLARALAQGADLLLLDEPLTAVDGETRAVIDQVLQELQQGGTTVLCATHELGRLASAFDRAFFLNEGHEVGAPDRSAGVSSAERNGAWTG